ncbi:hypothetical protein BH11ARM1_BH11ARM1_02320 [soil metagenome]
MQRGVYPAAVTPFDASGKIDYPSLARLIAWFATTGCKGLVVAGTNGEGPSLSAFEKKELINQTVALAKPFGLESVLGIATPSLDEAIWLSKQAANAGAVATLLMPPSYFREVDESGLEKWFKAVMDASPIPVLIYNLPKRTGFELSANLLGRLSQHDQYLGTKDSSGTHANLAAYRAATGEKLLYVGDETLLLDALKAGWTGTISGAANAVPHWLSEIVTSESPTKFEYLLPALKALRSLPQPASNKTILVRKRIISNDVLKLPLVNGGMDLTDQLKPWLDA